MSQEAADLAAALAEADEWGPEKLTYHERWWVQHRSFFEQAGYSFRARYQPGWVASWTGTDDWYRKYEDGQYQPVRKFHFPSHN